MAAAGKVKEAEDLLQKVVDDGKGEVFHVHTSQILLAARQARSRGNCFLNFAHLHPKPIKICRLIAPRSDRAVAQLEQQRLAGAKPIRQDVGIRPPLDSLGPINWQPPLGQRMDPSRCGRGQTQFSGLQRQNVVVIMYLGFGCLHCVRTTAFAPRADEFRQAGWELIAIGTDSQESLREALSSYGRDRIRFPLLTDPQLSVFRAYRCFDDFEQKPLHGEFLIDAQGRTRWQDIAHEPFVVQSSFSAQPSSRSIDNSRAPVIPAVRLT